MVQRPSHATLSLTIIVNLKSRRQLLNFRMLSRKTSDIPVSEQYRQWKDLLTELLKAIAKRLTSIADYTAFRSVCTSWRAAATFNNFDTEFPRVPFLVYFVEETETPLLADGKIQETPVLGDEKIEEILEETPIRRKIVTNFLDLESNTSKIVNFPPAMDRRYLSSFGWILSVSDDSEEVSLKHYMLGKSISLPGLNTFPIPCTSVITSMIFPGSRTSFITKMVLSGSPVDEADHLVVMVIWGFDDQLAFCRPGDQSWTIMDWWEGFFYDIIYHNGKLYALDSSLRILECDIHGSNPTKIVQVFQFPGDDILEIDRGVEQKFLAESFGKFLIVLQYKTRNDYHEIDRHHNFRIFEIELNDGSYEKIDYLGKRCLFLGLNSSICVEFFASSSVKLSPNCIYLANIKPYSHAQDVGVYTLCDGRFEDFSGMLCCCHPPPVWVVPTI